MLLPEIEEEGRSRLLPTPRLPAFLPGFNERVSFGIQLRAGGTRSPAREAVGVQVLGGQEALMEIEDVEILEMSQGIALAAAQQVRSDVQAGSLEQRGNQRSARTAKAGDHTTGRSGCLFGHDCNSNRFV